MSSEMRTSNRDHDDDHQHVSEQGNLLVQVNVKLNCHIPFLYVFSEINVYRQKQFFLFILGLNSALFCKSFLGSVLSLIRKRSSKRNTARFRAKKLSNSTTPKRFVTRCQFHQHCTCSFFVQKCNAQLFGT